MNLDLYQHRHQLFYDLLQRGLKLKKEDYNKFIKVKQDAELLKAFNIAPIFISAFYPFIISKLYKGKPGMNGYQMTFVVMGASATLAALTYGTFKQYEAHKYRKMDEVMKDYDWMNHPDLKKLNAPLNIQ